MWRGASERQLGGLAEPGADLQDTVACLQT